MTSSLRIFSASAALTLAADAALAGTGAAAAPGRPAHCCAVVELRQYALHPDRFDAFSALFDSTFLEPLEAAGMTVIGQFRDLDDPNRFVWMRGFADMPARAAALSAFYDGALWKAHRAEANAHFTDTDNVLLLHPASAGSGVALGPREHAQAGDGGTVVVTVYSLEAAHADAFPGFFERTVQPELGRAGIAVAARYVTEASANTFPRLPVREGEHVFVWLARFADARQADAALAALHAAPARRTRIAPALQAQFSAAPQVLRLAPTARSRLRGG